MSYLLDTHVLIWWLAGDSRLKPAIETIIAAETPTVYLSAVAVLEISLKMSVGKLQMHKHWFKVLKDQGFIELPVTVEHAKATGTLPKHHGDPFDRLLIAQALVEDFTIVTHDRTFEQYDAKALVF